MLLFPSRKNFSHDEIAITSTHLTYFEMEKYVAFYIFHSILFFKVIFKHVEQYEDGKDDVILSGDDGLAFSIFCFSLAVSVL